MRERSCSLVAENLFFFPEEILYEILSWLGVKSLLRCKSVCKIWYAVIENKQFVDLHALRTSQWFCNVKRIGKLRNSDGTEEEISYLSNSSQGFLLAKNLFFASAARPSTKPSATYQIYNPSTRRVLDLPRPRDTVKSMFVFLNSSTSSYNVVSVCSYYYKENNYDKYKEKLELIDLGGQSNDSCQNADLSWRNLHISEYDNLSRYDVYFRYCMSSEGVLYILAAQNNQTSNPKIICADLVKQTCTSLIAPQSLRSHHPVGFQLWRGQPSITFILEETLNVWKLEDYKKQKWADTILIPMPFLKPNQFMSNVPLLYQVDEEECLFYRKDDRSDFVYKLVTKEFCTIPTLRMKVPSTLVSVKGMQSKTMKQHALIKGL